MHLIILFWSGTLAYVAADVTTEVPNRCPQQTDETTPLIMYGHPDDCSYFFECDHGNPILKKCPNGTVWSDTFQAIVGFNTHFDTCTRENAQRECGRRQGSPLIIPHPRECQRFYNCSKQLPPAAFFGQYEDECHYPDVLDVTLKICKSFKEADCGPFRVAAKDPCDYLKNLCGGPNCQDCRSRLPSCEGLSDGIHEHPSRLWTPYYITCDTERLASILSCGRHYPTRWGTIYSPVKQACLSFWEIPRENGGLAPSCDGKPAGQYRTQENTSVYYTCPGSEVSYCGFGFEFNESNGRCEQQV